MSGQIAEEFRTMGRASADVLVHLKEDDSVLLKHDLRLLLDQLKYRQTKISAFGFYYVKYSTLLKILGYMSTYTIVVLQFPSVS